MSVSWEVAEQFKGNWLREYFLSCLGASALGRSGIKKSIRQALSSFGGFFRATRCRHSAVKSVLFVLAVRESGGRIFSPKDPSKRGSLFQKFSPESEFAEKNLRTVVKSILLSG